jgi:hypothetical protein
MTVQTLSCLCQLSITGVYVCVYVLMWGTIRKDHFNCEKRMS